MHPEANLPKQTWSLQIRWGGHRLTRDIFFLTLSARSWGRLCNLHFLWANPDFTDEETTYINSLSFLITDWRINSSCFQAWKLWKHCVCSSVLSWLLQAFSCVKRSLASRSAKVRVKFSPFGTQSGTPNDEACTRGQCTLLARYDFVVGPERRYFTSIKYFKQHTLNRDRFQPDWLKSKEVKSWDLYRNQGLHSTWLNCSWPHGWQECCCCVRFVRSGRVALRSSWPWTCWTPHQTSRVQDRCRDSGCQWWHPEPHLKMESMNQR